ncbi:MAG TPA: 6-phosphogluconolactonase [Terriglobales bacterium]|nr:6-phosphogluconolactonase [Terriglobales bacterium]
MAAIQIFETPEKMATAAAEHAGSVLRGVILKRQKGLLIIAIGTSQDHLIDALTQRPDIERRRVAVFHMEEYVGIADTHPTSFRRWLRMGLADIVHPAAAHHLNGDAVDSKGEANRYGRLLDEKPVDLCFLEFGENGHIAFNDPPSVDFHDPETVKRVQLDQASRRQQVGEGHFPTIEDVPDLLSLRAVSYLDLFRSRVPKGAGRPRRLGRTHWHRLSGFSGANASRRFRFPG